MKKTPCKQNKCVLYPVCLNKEEIRCEALHNYFRYMEKSIGFDKACSKMRKLFKHTTKILRMEY